MEVNIDLSPEGGPRGSFPVHSEAAIQARNRSDNFEGLRSSWSLDTPLPRGPTPFWSEAAIESVAGAVGVASPIKIWLTEAVSELDEIDVEADEAGDPRPEAICKVQAKRILRELAKLTLPLPVPAVYPGESGEVEISFQCKESKSGVLVSCEPQGAACYVSVAGKTRRARYDDANQLPDPFLTDALAQLTGDP